MTFNDHASMVRVMKNTLTFLKKIAKNNNTPWMHAHKEEYLTAKKEFEFLVQEVIHRLREWDPKMPMLEPKDCMFRFNRDIRFSDNKKPYKENFGAYLGYDGKKGIMPGYYLHIAPKEVFVAGGVWMPQAPELLKIRRHLAHHGQTLEKIMKEKNFKKHFDGLDEAHLLTRPPKGFFADDPNIELIKYKSFTISHNMKVEDVLKPGFGKLVDKNFKVMKDFNHYFLGALNPL